MAWLPVRHYNIFHCMETCEEEPTAEGFAVPPPLTKSFIQYLIFFQELVDSTTGSRRTMDVRLETQEEEEEHGKNFLHLVT